MLDEVRVEENFNRVNEFLNLKRFWFFNLIFLLKNLEKDEQIQ